MHLTPRAYVQSYARRWPGGRVLEIGSRDVNGSVRSLFQRRPTTTYVGIDIVEGPGVDVVVDARHFVSERAFDLVLCLEVLEHAPDPAGIIAAAARALRPFGELIVSCAGPARAPHGAAGGLLLPGEHYHNLELGELDRLLNSNSLWPRDLRLQRDGQDLIGSAVKGGGL